MGGAIGWNYKGQDKPQVQKRQEAPKRGSNWTSEKQDHLVRTLAPLVGMDATNSSDVGHPVVANSGKSAEQGLTLPSIGGTPVQSLNPDSKKNSKASSTQK